MCKCAFGVGGGFRYFQNGFLRVPCALCRRRRGHRNRRAEKAYLDWVWGDDDIIFESGFQYQILNGIHYILRAEHVKANQNLVTSKTKIDRAAWQIFWVGSGSDSALSL